MPASLPDVPLRSGSFALEDRWLLWARVQLYPDRLELTGWSLAGWHQREIPLERVAVVDHEDDRLQLGLQSGETVSLLLEDPGRWAEFVRTQDRVRGEDGQGES
jgi:hypothetical protein